MEFKKMAPYKSGPEPEWLSLGSLIFFSSLLSGDKNWEPMKKGVVLGPRRVPKMEIRILVGGFNPSEKYQSTWESSPNRGEHKKYLKPPPRIGFYLDYPEISNRSH